MEHFDNIQENINKIMHLPESKHAPPAMILKLENDLRTTLDHKEERECLLGFRHQGSLKCLMGIEIQDIVTIHYH